MKDPELTRAQELDPGHLFDRKPLLHRRRSRQQSAQRCLALSELTGRVIRDRHTGSHQDEALARVCRWSCGRYVGATLSMGWTQTDL